jgi:hypothetical protein
MKPDLSSLPSSSESSPAGGDPDMTVDPLVTAASAVREAFESGDDESLADALKSFCGMMGDSSPAEKMGPAKPKLLTALVGRKS